MISSSREIDETLRRIDRNLLFYTLCEMDTEMRRRYERLDEAEFRKVGSYDSCREGLEAEIDGEFRRLFVRQHGSVFISREAAENIHTHAIEGIEANFLGTGLSALRRLKRAIVNYSQDMALRSLEEHLAPLAGSLLFLRDTDGCSLALPQDAGEMAAREEYAMKVMGAIGSVDPDGVGDCVEAAGKVVLGGDEAVLGRDSLALGASMLQGLDKELLRSCLTPRMCMEVAKMVSAPDQYRRDYAMLHLQMEEVGMRLAHVQRRGMGLFASMFGGDIFSELDDAMALLEGYRRMIGAERGEESGLIDDVRSGKRDLAAVLLDGIASRGPRHLEIARRYAGVFSAEIKNKVFGRGIDVPGANEQKRYIIVTDPKAVILLDREELAEFGFTEAELAALPGRSYCIVSTYTIYANPPERCPDDFRLSAEAERYRGGLSYGETVRVVDIGDRDKMPKLLESVMSDCKASDSGRLQEALEELELPAMSAQVWAEGNVIFTRGFGYKEEVRNMARPAYKRSPPGTGSSIHRFMRRWAIDNINTDMMTREQFMRWLAWSRE